ncbi:DNA-directed DNA polymerase [Tanacetum coccineum]
MEETVYKFIDEGTQEHEEMRAFIREFKTSNKLLFKERNNSLSELRFEVHGLSKVVDNTLISNSKVKGVTTRGLLTNKARLEEAYTVIINKRCSAILLNKLPFKEKDPGSFTIPYDIGHLHINNTLADLGASISLVPYMMYEKLGVWEPKPTRMSLELADRSIQYSRGIIENVLIKVDKFILLIDFVILDMPEDSRVSIILVRPFLAIARVIIDVFNKKITLRVGDDEVIFDIDQSIKRPPIEDDECYDIDDLDNIINIETQELLGSDQSDSFLLKGLEKLIYQSDLESYNSIGNDSDDNSDTEMLIRRIDSVNTSSSEAQKTARTEGVLEKCKGAIAWKMSDIKGISPSFYTHKILMEDDFKPVIQPQRHLIPKVQDVVKNKIVKLLNSGLIYPISDSSWVSPIHVVPKKGGTTVVLNYNNELIPSCIVTGWRMPFGLCNVPATFQRCMTTIFHDMVEDFMEVFMDNFSVFGNSFNCCLLNLDKVLARCEETNFVLNWEKCHFMVKEGIVLGHKISGASIEVDRAKIDVIAKLPYPTNVKGVRSFLGHAGFYRRFIKDFP